MKFFRSLAFKLTLAFLLVGLTGAVLVAVIAYCIDVIRQIQAVQAALNKVSTMILEEHLNSCLITAVRGEDPAERERVRREIADVFEASTKTSIHLISRPID